MGHIQAIKVGLPMLMVAAKALGSESITLESLLKEMVDRSQVAQISEPTYTCRQFSSYDRSSVAPDQPGWFANGDRNQFLRTETNDGRTEHVMMETEGPGTIVRWWITMAGPHSGKGTIRVYLDGDENPVIEGTPYDVISRGLLAPAPLSDSVSKATRENRRGHNLYYPIPYAKSCKVTFERAGNGAFYYQINYRTYAAETRIESYSPEQAATAEKTLRETAKKLRDRDRNIDPSWVKTSLAGTLEPGESRSINLDGPAAIRELLVNINATDPEQALRSTILKITFDGNQTVWCPVGDFFGIGHETLAYSSWYTQAKPNGTLGCWWVMPFEKSATVTLENLGHQLVELQQGHVAVADWNWNDRSMHFRCTWRQLYQHQTKGRNGPKIHPPNAEDINFVTIHGSGKYVGDSLALYNGGTHWWGEGDEKIWVDDEAFPSHFGTGTEDYYGYAWCEHAEFDHPFIALPSGAGNGTPRNPSCPGYTVGSRWRALDAIPFKQSFRFDMELWHWRKAWVNYAPATFFYTRPDASVEPHPAPEQARKPVPKDQEDVRPPGS